MPFLRLISGFGIREISTKIDLVYWSEKRIPYNDWSALPRTSVAVAIGSAMKSRSGISLYNCLKGR
jgi:hypothetical protein